MHHYLHYVPELQKLAVDPLAQTYTDNDPVLGRVSVSRRPIAPPIGPESRTTYADDDTLRGHRRILQNSITPQRDTLSRFGWLLENKIVNPSFRRLGPGKMTPASLAYLGLAADSVVKRGPTGLVTRLPLTTWATFHPQAARQPSAINQYFRKLTAPPRTFGIDETKPAIPQQAAEDDKVEQRIQHLRQIAK